MLLLFNYLIWQWLNFKYKNNPFCFIYILYVIFFSIKVDFDRFAIPIIMSTSGIIYWMFLRDYYWSLFDRAFILYIFFSFYFILYLDRLKLKSTFDLRSNRIELYFYIVLFRVFESRNSAIEDKQKNKRQEKKGFGVIKTKNFIIYFFLLFYFLSLSFFNYSSF